MMYPRKYRGKPAANIRLRIACLLAMLVVSGGCGDEQSPEAGRHALPPAHVVMISIDTLRADRLGCYGYDRATSPNLDALAAESVVFANAGAQSAQTLISHKSMLTGKHPLRIVHETTNADLKKLQTLPSPRRFVENTFANMKSPTLVEGLRARGYRTAAFTDGRWMTRTLNFDKGFDDFNDDGGHLESILPRVSHWLNRVGAARFFLFVHTYDVHCPYPCREPYNSLFCKDHTRHIFLEGKCGKPDLVNMDLSEADLRAISDHYDGGIASADAYLGEFFTRLRGLGLYDETLIIVTSDHGESLGEHDQIGHGGLYLEQLLIPLIIKFPASWGIAPRRIEQPVELADVMPTVCEACDVELPDRLDGKSLLDLARGGGEWSRECIIAQITYNEGRESITNPAKRAVLYPRRLLLIHDARAPAAELFNLYADPAGLTPSPAKDSDAFVEMMAQLASNDPHKGDEPFASPEKAKISDELRRQLGALGYVQP